MDIFLQIERLLKFAEYKGLIYPEDRVYSRNRLLAVLGLQEFKEIKCEDEKLDSATDILNNILEWAFENGKLESNSPVYRDLLDTEIMDCIMPRPSEVVGKFNQKYSESPEEATNFFYELSKASNYIRTDRVKKNLAWKTKTEYGDIDITINLSKPEKDPKAIAAARNMKAKSYPKCLLCRDNEGYSGRINHPARQTHRIIPIELQGNEWFFQFSPYVYYNEHSIIFKGKHEPMKISKETFDRLLEFTEKIPHYFVGSNADLPIVGGSILSHDHFQGGNYKFAMTEAPVGEVFRFKGFEDIEVGIVEWPMSVLRIAGKDRKNIAELGEKILNEWKCYNDSRVSITSHTGDIEHNTITPIARNNEGVFQLDLVLRNNRTSEEFPHGIFHPHEELHNIKKENIGLIEVMGLAVLPARLKSELKRMKELLLKRDGEIERDEGMTIHKAWYYQILDKYEELKEENIDHILMREVGEKFKEVLENAGVFKRDEEGQRAFKRFIESVRK